MGSIQPSRDQVLIPIYVTSKIVKGHLPELSQDVRSESTRMSFRPVPDRTETSEDNLRITAIRHGDKPYIQILVWRGELFDSEGRTWLRTPTYQALDPETALAHARGNRLGFVVANNDYDLSGFDQDLGPGPEPEAVPEPEPEPIPEPAPKRSTGKIPPSIEIKIDDRVIDVPVGWHMIDGSESSPIGQYIGCNRCLGVRGIGDGHPCPRCRCPEYSLIVHTRGYFEVGRQPAYVEDDQPKAKGRKPKVNSAIKAIEKLANNVGPPKSRKLPEDDSQSKSSRRDDLPGQGMLF